MLGGVHLSDTGLRTTALLAMLGAASLNAQPNETQTVWQGVYTAQQAARGAQIYAVACAHCHGPDLKERDGAPPLAAPEFLAAWQGYSAGDLVERMRRTMPPGTPGNMGAQGYVDLLALILQANQMPPGQTELDNNPQRLKQIRFDTKNGGSPR